MWTNLAFGFICGVCAAIWFWGVFNLIQQKRREKRKYGELFKTVRD